MSRPAFFSTGRLRQWFILAIVWVVAFDVAFVWQRVAGAHVSEFGGHPDEPAQYITGLMVRDYIAAGFPGRPMAYANNYAHHYPEVAFGAWPPVFHLVQAAWTLPFGVGPMAMMLLMCALAGILAVLLFRAANEEFGPRIAAAATLGFICLPLVREYYSLVMPETLSAIFMFAAALSFGQFLDDDRPRHALWFGVLAGLAVMTQGTGLALVLLLPIALILAGKLRLLARPALWGGAAIAALIAGPWTWHFRHQAAARAGWAEAAPTWDFAREAFPYYLGKLGFTVGLILAILLCVGILARLTRPTEHRGRWAALAGLLVAVILFHCIIPIGMEERHLLPAIPAAVMFICAGALAAGQWFANRRKQSAPCTAASAAIVLLVLGLAGVELSVRLLKTAPSKHWSGFAKLADELVTEDPSGKRAILISSDAIGEGIFIAEIAMREPRPLHVIKRASKELATSDRDGRNLRRRFEGEDDVANWFANAGVDYVIVDESMPEQKRTEHHDQLIQAVDNHSERFFPMTKATIMREGQENPEPITLYRVKHVD